MCWTTASSSIPDRLPSWPPMRHAFRRSPARAPRSGRAIEDAPTKERSDDVDHQAHDSIAPRPPKLPLDVLDAQACCPLRAYFLFHGETGIKSDFEKLALETREELGPKTNGLKEVGGCLGCRWSASDAATPPTTEQSLRCGNLCPGPAPEVLSTRRFDGAGADCIT